MTPTIRPFAARSATPPATDPWRLFFPLGAALACAGILDWLLYAVGLTADYAAVFHATAQIQGFMTCLACGFLLTFLPRRTGTPPATRRMLVLMAVAPVAATVAAWFGAWTTAQLLWLAGAAALAEFAVRRILTSPGRERLPGVFVWVPVALAAGGVGAVLVAVAAALGPREVPELWRLGRGLLLQGLFAGLVVGVGATMIPQLTRGADSVGARRGGEAGRGVHLAAATLFLASFPLEVYLAPRLGLALRALVAGGTLVWTARLWQVPTAPGLHRWLIWCSAWLLPVGYILAAALPDHRVAALHVLFIGCFAVMALAVSLHVSLSHGGRPERLKGRPAAVWAMGTLLFLALVFRLLVSLDARRFEWWLGLGAGAFLLAMAAWATLVLPAIRSAGRPGATP